MTSTPPLQPGQDTIVLPRTRHPDEKEKEKPSPLSSVANLPYRRSNASLSTLFASTSSLPTTADHGHSGSDTQTVTPPVGGVNGSLFSPPAPASTKASSPAPLGKAGNETRDVILQAFSPHVSILASPDTEELIRHKGIHGGLLQLLRPYGEHIQGKVTIRDHTGVSRSWDDFAVRFTGVKDGLDSPRLADRSSMDSLGSQKRMSLQEYFPARLRTGGDVQQIEELVERHLTFAEENSGPVMTDYMNHKEELNKGPGSVSPFHLLYMRRLLSGLPLVPSETFSHPVASVIAISSRSPNPIEELRSLYASSNSGEDRLPPWVHNEFLRYYILIHDEDYDDIRKSMSLYDQMKRHFGLHCHLLRLRSTQCVPTDDEAVKLPGCEWTSAAEELAEIVRRESSDDDLDSTPCVFESDANALKALVREMVTQSIIPSMERASATWNDQVASRRRGISGRFMSLSKRFTTFGNRGASGPSLGGGGGGGNYDGLQGVYRPDAPESILRKLADYAMMLRDHKLAQTTYEILCQDYKTDKAWRHYAGANEMAAVSTLLATNNMSSKTRVESVDAYLEAAYYSYITRVNAPYNALRTLIFGTELLKLRGGSALDDAARWCTKILDDRLIGPTGHALLTERIALCFAERKGVGGLKTGERRRKAAFWNLLATDAWLQQDKTSQAEKCLVEATKLYGLDDGTVAFEHIAAFLASLRETVRVNRPGIQHLDVEAAAAADEEATVVEALQSEQTAPTSPLHSPSLHRKSLSLAAGQMPASSPAQASFDPLGAVPSAYAEDEERVPMSPVPASPNAGARGRSEDDGFE
ncbi:hypothetical protein MBLNU230_g2314t1 [Neophaeotheca triangularis]